MTSDLQSCVVMTEWPRDYIHYRHIDISSDRSEEEGAVIIQMAVHLKNIRVEPLKYHFIQSSQICSIEKKKPVIRNLPPCSLSGITSQSTTSNFQSSCLLAGSVKPWRVKLHFVLNPSCQVSSEVVPELQRDLDECDGYEQAMCMAIIFSGSVKLNVLYLLIQTPAGTFCMRV